MNTLPDPLAVYISNVLERLEGWCSPEKASRLADSVISGKPAICVEIGVFAGRSLFAIALALAHNHAGLAIGIDPWDSVASTEGFPSNTPNHEWWGKLNHATIHKQCTEYIRALGLQRYVHIVKSTSAQALPGFLIAQQLNQDQPFIDLLHIDGNHSEESALHDVNNFIPLVRPGCEVWFDDVDWPETRPAQARLKELCDTVDMVGNCMILRKK